MKLKTIYAGAVLLATVLFIWACEVGTTGAQGLPCNSNRECGQGLFCAAGLCSTGDSGGACDSRNPCAGDLICGDDSVCGVALGDSCVPGDVCAGASAICSMLAGVCVFPGMAGDPCSVNDDECTGALICTGLAGNRECSASTGAAGSVCRNDGHCTATDTLLCGTNATCAEPGTVWSAQRNATGEQLLDVHYGGSQWVAVGSTMSGGVITTSTNGTIWRALTSGVSVGLPAVHYANTLWVAVGESGTIMTSSDGITWMSATVDTRVNGDLKDIHYASDGFDDGSTRRGLWVAVGENMHVAIRDPR